MLVMGILMSVIWPNIGARKSSGRLESTAQQLASLLTMARSGAMCTGSSYRCVFDTNGMRALIETEEDPVKQPGDFQPLKAHWASIDLGSDNIKCISVHFDKWDSLLKEQEAKILDNDKSESENADSPPIVFYPDGTSDSAMILLGDDYNNNFTLTLNGMTGQVTMTRGNELDVLEKGSSENDQTKAKQ